MIVKGIMDGVYYENGAAKMAGLVKIGDDYYFAGGAGRIVKDKVQYIWASSTGELSETNQTFGADGRMVA